MKKWTARDIPAQTGKVAIVTGANSGLGLVTARELARAGATVVIACRDTSRGQAARDDILKDCPGADVAVERLDLADLVSVRTFSDNQTRAIDLLVNNAGVMALPYARTLDGFEMQFGTNHLGHFALTGLLLPKMNPGARVVTMSSAFHHIGRMQWDDLHGRARYDRWAAYSQSKLANLLFSFGLHRRLQASGRHVSSLAAHPGYAATNLQGRAAQVRGQGMEALRRGLEGRLLQLMNVVIAQPDTMGALPELYAATVPDLASGSYIGPGAWAEMRGHPVPVKPSRHARDEASADRLWRISEQLTGVCYAFQEPSAVRRRVNAGSARESLST